MTIKQIPSALRKKFHFDEREHAISILARDFPKEFRCLMACLDDFWLAKTHILTPGGGRSPIPIQIDGFLRARGWREQRFDTKIVVDGNEIPSPTHKIDNFRNRVGVEVEWKNEAEFFDRDLNNFRLLRQLHVSSVGVIITRMPELRSIFVGMGKWKSYGGSTTQMDNLIPKIDGGAADGCPLLLIGFGLKCYKPHR